MCYNQRSTSFDLEAVMMNHILLEIFCLKDTDEHADKPLPDFCKCADESRYECLSNNCPYIAFTSCENTLCYINERSEAEEIVSLGEEDDIELWKDISLKAIDKAYKEFLDKEER